MSTENVPVDEHDAAGFAGWLRMRADENRRVADLPRNEWPYHPNVLRHLAFRFEQGAKLVEQQATTVLQAQHERDAAIEDVARLKGELFVRKTTIARQRAKLERIERLAAGNITGCGTCSTILEEFAPDVPATNVAPPCSCSAHPQPHYHAPAPTDT